MISLSEIAGFEWDAGNDRKSLNKHYVTKLEAEEMFFNVPILLLNDDKHSEKEPRFHALGKTDTGRLLHITFTIRASKLRVISARDMHRKEKKVYENKT